MVNHICKGRMRKKLHLQGTIGKKLKLHPFLYFLLSLNSLLFKNPHPHCLNKVDAQYISLSFHSRSFESILLPMRWKLNVSNVRMPIPFGSWIPAEKSYLHSRLRKSYFHGTIHGRVAVNMALSYSFINFFLQYDRLHDAPMPSSTVASTHQGTRRVSISNRLSYFG